MCVFSRFTKVVSHIPVVLRKTHIITISVLIGITCVYFQCGQPPSRIDLGLWLGPREYHGGCVACKLTLGVSLVYQKQTSRGSQSLLNREGRDKEKVMKVRGQGGCM